MRRFTLLFIIIVLIIFGYYWSGPYSQNEIQSPKQELAQKNADHPIGLELPHTEKPIPRAQDLNQENREEKEIYTFENSEAWEVELYDILRHMDSENADITLKNYQLEMAAFKQDQEIVLAESINSLRLMSGESLGKERRSGIDLNARERQHQEKIKKILGENYQFILERYRLFRDTTALNK